MRGLGVGEKAEEKTQIPHQPNRCWGLSGLATKHRTATRSLTPAGVGKRIGGVAEEGGGAEKTSTLCKRSPVNRKTGSGTPSIRAQRSVGREPWLAGMGRQVGELEERSSSRSQRQLAEDTELRRAVEIRAKVKAACAVLKRNLWSCSSRSLLYVTFIYSSSCSWWKSHFKAQA